MRPEPLANRAGAHQAITRSLLRALDDDDPDCAKPAAEQFGKLGAREAVDPLRAAEGVASAGPGRASRDQLVCGASVSLLEAPGEFGRRRIRRCWR